MRAKYDGSITAEAETWPRCIASRFCAGRAGLIGGFLFGVALALTGAPSAKAEDVPKRIAIAGGDLTEIVFALGEGGRVVAVDTTSSHPAETKKLPKIGYMRRLAPEGVLSMRPDLLLGSADAGPDAALDRLRQAGVTVKLGPQDATSAGIAKKILFVGEILGREAAAKALAKDVNGKLKAAVVKAQARKIRPRVLFLMTAGRSGLMAAGDGTSAQEIIQLAGGANAISGFEGYKPLSAEAALAAAPDVLLIPAHAARALGGVEKALEKPELAATPAGRSKNVVVMDGLLLLGFGPRTPEAVNALSAAIHKDR